MVTPGDQPPVERVRRFYELWSTGSYTKAATFLFDPEIELVQPAELPGGGGTYRRYEGLQQALDEWLEASEYIHAEAERLACGENIVVATVRLRSRGRHTGMELDRRIGHLFRSRRGSSGRGAGRLTQKRQRPGAPGLIGRCLAPRGSPGRCRGLRPCP